MLIDNSLQFNEITQRIKIDDEVKLKLAGSREETRGFVVGYGWEQHSHMGDEEIFVIELYYLPTRNVKKYQLTPKVELLQYEKLFTPPMPFDEPDIYFENSEKTSFRFFAHIKQMVINFVVLMLIASFLITGAAFSDLPRTTMSYEQFLNTKYSLVSMVGVVNRQLRYVKDYSDVWHTAEFAWRNNMGDCEEYAFVIGEYLERRNYEVGVWVVPVPQSAEMHAIIYATKGDKHLLIDALGSVLPQKIKKLPKKVNNEMLLAIFKTESIGVFAIPQYNGEKRALGVLVSNEVLIKQGNDH